MKFVKDKKYLYIGLTLFLVSCGGIFFYYLLNHWNNVISIISKFFSIMMPIVDGFVLAYLMIPAVNKLEDLFYNNIAKKHTFSEKGKKTVRMVSVIITMFFFSFLIIQFLKLVIPEIYTSVINISIQFPTYVTNLEEFINRTLAKYPELENTVNVALVNYSDAFNEWLNSSVVPQISNIFKAVTNGIVVAVKTLLNLVVGIIISVYLLFNKELFLGQFKKIIYATMKRNTANAFVHNLKFTNKTFSNFIVGKIVDSILIGLICFIVTTIIGTPYATLISVIIGVTNLIPFFGPFIGAIPSGLLVLMVDPKACLYFVIAIFIIQQFDGNILGPKILGESTGLSGFWVIFAITLFGGIFGILGWLVGVPIFAVIYAGIKSYVKSKLQEQNLEWQTQKYINVDYIDDNNNFITIPDEEIIEVKSRKQFRNPFRKNNENSNIEATNQENIEKISENNNDN